MFNRWLQALSDIDIVGMAIRWHRTAQFGLSLLITEDGVEIKITFPKLGPLGLRPQPISI
jgi:hypothetical protein